MDGLKKDIKKFYKEHIENYDNVICIKGCVRGTTNRCIPVNGVPSNSSIQLSGMVFGEFVSKGDKDYNIKLHKFINDKSINNKDKIDNALIELKQRVENYLINNCSIDGRTLDTKKTLMYTSNCDNYKLNVSVIVNEMIDGFVNKEEIITY